VEEIKGTEKEKRMEKEKASLICHVLIEKVFRGLTLDNE
jgi:hypothetical protein